MPICIVRSTRLHSILRPRLMITALFAASLPLLLMGPIPWMTHPKDQSHEEQKERTQSRLSSNQTLLLSSASQYILSAYFDTRSTLEGRKFVRLIAVLDTSAYQNELLCLFLDADEHISFSSLARKSKMGFGMKHQAHEYLEFVLTCPILDDLGLATFVFVQSYDATMRSEVLRVKHNPASLGQQPQFPPKIINCVSVTFGRPSEYRLIEWMEAQRLLKVDKVVLHLHHMLNKEFERVAQAYVDEGFLDIRYISCPFCVPGKDNELPRMLKSPSIDQCFYENLGGYEHTAVFDLDEIIVPQQHQDIPTMLKALHLLANTSSYAFSNWYHLFELGEDPKIDKRMAMLRHPFRVKEPSKVGWYTKSIHRSSCVVTLHNHFHWEDVPRPNTQGMCHHVALDMGLNEHFKKCNLYENECKEMTKESDRLEAPRLRQLMGKQLTEAFLKKVKELMPKAKQ